MNQWQNADVETLYDAILCLETREDCARFFEDACTVREILDLSQRLKVARRLKDGASYNTIRSETGAGAATISRVSRCLEYGAGGYRDVLERLEKKNENK